MKDIGNAPALKKGMYEHFKGGIYEVLDVACNTDTLEWYVIYESQERKAKGLPSLWVREYNEFFDEVTRDGKTFPRFKYLGENV